MVRGDRLAQLLQRQAAVGFDVTFQCILTTEKTRTKMRKSKQEAAKTQQRIVTSAAAEFRRHGINGIGLSGLMAASGLTSALS